MNQQDSFVPQDSPNSLHLFVFMSCVFPSILNQGWPIWTVEYCRSDSVWLPRLGHNRHLPLPPWCPGLLFLGEAICHVIRAQAALWRGPCKEEVTPTTSGQFQCTVMWLSSLGNRSASSNQPSGDCHSSQHLNEQINPKSRLPSEAASEFLTLRNQVIR